ncbi:histidine kinase [Microvirga antarctica]|uniref:histidine kinase n=1 Tax=Microvirga antarctica TaxID=2819233 RepID=UPI001B317C84|nr:histidine kinase [Microvirga antarctica]
MADYYPLIARAVEGLSDTSPETRRAVYERARTALLGQLRAMEPPLSERDIEIERVSLNEAIERVESDFAAPLSATANLPVASPAVPRPAPVPYESAVAAASRPPEPDVVERPRVESRPHPGMNQDRRGRTVLLGGVLALVIAAIAGLAFWQRDKPENLTPETTVAQTPQAAPDAAKTTERVGGPAAPAPSAPAPRQEVGVAQRAVFYEEDPATPSTPKAQTGRVVWRLEDVSAGQGQPLDTAVSASVDIPDAGLTMKMLLRRNLDTTLPASHTVELSFTTRAGDSGRVIRDAGLLQFKDEEAARGTPVAGLPVPVRENLFLIGLSNLSGDVERNTELLVRRNWIDLPVRMASGQRAILSFEKGASGEQVLTRAFGQWR